MAVASLVLGILSIILSFCTPAVQWLGAILGIVGIVLGALNGNMQNAGIAKGGKICSIIGLILNIVLFVACVACIGTAGIIGSFA